MTLIKGRLALSRPTAGAGSSGPTGIGFGTPNSDVLTPGVVLVPRVTSVSGAGWVINGTTGCLVIPKAGVYVIQARAVWYNLSAAGAWVGLQCAFQAWTEDDRWATVKYDGTWSLSHAAICAYALGEDLQDIYQAANGIGATLANYTIKAAWVGNSYL